MMTQCIEAIVSACREVSPDGASYVPYRIEGKLVKEAIEKNQIAQGENIGLFERWVERFTESKNAILCSSGTLGLYVALKVLKVTGTVMTQALTFVGTANAITMAGCRVEFTDVDDNGGMDVEDLERKIKEHKPSAVIPVHVHGIPCNIAAIQDLCNRYNILLIEDAAAALGSFAGMKHCGTYGIIGMISLNGNKIITTGGGGVLLTKYDEVATEIRKYISQAKAAGREYAHEYAATNARMSNLQASYGFEQARQYAIIHAAKKKVFEKYRIICDEYGIEYLRPREEDIWNHWVFTVKTEQKNRLADALTEAGIDCRPIWIPLDCTAPYWRMNKARNAWKLYNQCITLPSGVLCA